MSRKRRKFATFWPIILRELRASSRQSQLFWLRIYSASLAIVTLVYLLVEGSGIVGAEIGATIFNSIKFTLFFTIISAGPIITADCISQEKREGTLGLLFLAPLSSLDIIMSKLIIHSFRALTLVLAVLPMLALPAVFGGVSLWDVISVFFFELSALCIALWSGMVASVRGRGWISCVVTAELFCAFVLLFLLPFGAIGQVIFTAVFCVAAFSYCIESLKRKWEEESSTFQPPEWIATFSESDFWRGVFRWNKSKTLDRNPMAWLQEYTWMARLAKWGWCAFVLLTQLGLIIAGYVGDAHPHLWIAGILALAISLSSANSFRKERNSGAFELILVTPLKIWQIVFGRAWGVWVHFFPAVSILLFCWYYAPFWRPPTSIFIWACASYLFIPLIGLCISLFRINILVAWFATFGLATLLPYWIATLFAKYFMPVSEAFAWLAILQSLFGIAAIAIMFDKLQNRKLSLQPG